MSPKPFAAPSTATCSRPDRAPPRGRTRTPRRKRSGRTQAGVVGGCPERIVYCDVDRASISSSRFPKGSST